MFVCCLRYYLTSLRVEGLNVFSSNPSAIAMIISINIYQHNLKITIQFDVMSTFSGWNIVAAKFYQCQLINDQYLLWD